jgi:RHS repeat-associated protein
LAVRWPGWRTNPWHQDAGAPDIVTWVGSLVDGMRDETGQMYMRNRYYDPATGQFTQPDPIGLAGGLNSYGFAAGDPVSYADPYGLFKIEYGDTKSNLQVVKLRATSPLIARDLEDMERHPDTFRFERGSVFLSPGTTWGPSLSDDNRIIRKIILDPRWVLAFAGSPVVQAGGGISQSNVWAHEIHSHAGPAARGEVCEDTGHGMDTCGIRAENEWRREQGLDDRTYSGVDGLEYPQSTTKPNHD